jgi:hypothetical protein
MEVLAIVMAGALLVTLVAMAIARPSRRTARSGEGDASLACFGDGGGGADCSADAGGCDGGGGGGGD